MATYDVTPLMMACQNNNPEDVANFISKGDNINALDSTNRTALFYCSENTDISCIEQLHKAKVNLNHQDKDGYSCLHVAVMCGNTVIVDYLIKNGADVNITDSEMHSVIHWSVVCGQFSIFEYLIAKNADPETADIHGAYPIHYAAQMCGKIDLMDEAVNRDHMKSLLILKKLIELKVKVDVEDFDQRNAIIWAASSGSDEAITELYKAGSDPNKHEKDGLTALHCAASRGHLECIQVLVDQCKCSVDIMDNNNCTPIFYAATLGQDKACSMLMKFGSNLHVQDCKGRTAYHCAAAKGQMKCLKILCQNNSNIWVRNRRGDYPIHEAYYNKQLDSVYYLLDAISDNQAYESANLYDNRTLLHLAASDNDLKLCKKLVENGSLDINSLMKSSNNAYLTPYDIAKIKKSIECEKYLKSNGGCSSNELGDGKQSKKPAKANKSTSKSIKEESKNNNNNKTKEKNTSNINKKNKGENNSKSKNVETDLNNSIDRHLVNRSAQTVITSTSTKQKLIMVDSSAESIVPNSTITNNSNSNSNQQSKDKNKNKKNITNDEPSNNSNTSSNKNTNNTETTNKKDMIIREKSNLIMKKFDEDMAPMYDSVNDTNNGDHYKLDQMHQSIDIEDDDEENLNEEIILSREDDLKNKEEMNENKSRGKTNKKFSLESDENVNRNKIITTTNIKPKKNTEKILAESYGEPYQDKKSNKVSSKDKGNNNRKMIIEAKISDEKAPFNNNGNEKKKTQASAQKFLREKTNNNNNNNNSNIKKENRVSDESLSPERKDSKNKHKSPTKMNDRINKKLNHNDSVNNNNNTNTSTFSNYDDSIVKLVIKGDEQNETNTSNNNLRDANSKKRMPSLFEQQRLILKSLYEIRRCRINNRDIVINSDLNNLLIKHYNFDIVKNCKSLKDLEKTLEIIAIEISDDYKKQQKRSHTLTSFKQKTFLNGQENGSKSNENLRRNLSPKSKAYKRDHDKTPTDGDTHRSRTEKLDHQNSQLKMAYKSLLPNDIYRQYYATNKSKTNADKLTMIAKEQSPREKSIFLPVITQKPGFST